MRFGIDVVPYEKPMELASCAKLAESEGMSHVLVSDHYSTRNIYISLSLIAMNTSRILIGPGVTNPYTIHPVITAQALASLDSIAPGRVVCGIGPGGQIALSRLGITRRDPLETCRESVQIIRTLLSNKPASSQEFFKLRNAKLEFGPIHSVPIFVGAQGHRMLQLAGEVGDGVLINACEPSFLRRAVGLFKDAAARVGRKPERLEIAVCTPLVLAEGDEGRRLVAPMVAGIIAGASREVLELHGVTTTTARTLRCAIQTMPLEKVTQLITRDMAERFAVFGRADECVEWMVQLSRIGITSIIACPPISGSTADWIKKTGRRVVSNLP